MQKKLAFFVFILSLMSCINDKINDSTLSEETPPLKNVTCEPSAGVRFSKSPLVHQNLIFVEGERYQLYAIDTSNGKIKWKTSIGNSPLQPIANEDTIYVYGSLITAINMQTGNIIWKLSDPYYRGKLLMLTQDYLYNIASNEFTLFSYNKNNGDINYRFPVDRVLTFFANDHFVYLFSQFKQEDIDFSYKIYVFDAKNRELLWVKNALTTDIYPVFSVDSVNHKLFYQSDSLYKVSAEKGNIEWKKSFENKINYLHFSNNVLYATDSILNQTSMINPQNGEVFNVINHPFIDPVFSKNNIYLSTVTTLSAIDIQSAQVIWKIPISSNKFTADEEKVYLINQKNFETSLDALDAKTGDLIWKVNLGQVPLGCFLTDGT